MDRGRFSAVIRAKDPKHPSCFQLVRYASEHGVRAAARPYASSRRTVRL